MTRGKLTEKFHGVNAQRSELLELYVNNEAQLYRSIVHHAKMLTALIDRAAVQLAKDRAEWHDDPQAEDHAEFHAPAIEQFPLWVRERAVMSLIHEQMTELRIREKAQVTA